MARSTVDRTPARALAFVAFTLAGVLVAHALSYALAVPDPYHRDLVLERTGHGYLPGLGELALVLVVGAIAASLATAAGRRSVPVASRGLGPWIVGAQVVAFVTLEITERALSGAPLAGLGDAHLLAIGVATQLLVGVGTAAVLRWLSSASQRLAELLSAGPSSPRPNLSARVLVRSIVAPRTVATPSDPIRGPPPR